MGILPEITLIIIGIALFDVCLVLLFMQLEGLIGRVRYSILKKQDSENLPVTPLNDEDVLRSSISRYFKYNQPGTPYRIEYDFYHTTIDKLRKSGWTITLEIDAEGNLFYAVHGSQVKA